MRELALEQRQTPQAKSHIEAVLKRMEKEGKGVRAGSEAAKLEDMRGQANVLDSKFEDAAKDFALAIEHDPALPSSYLRLARLLRTELRTRDPREADDLIAKLVRSNPELGTAYLTRFQYNTEFHPPANDRDLKKALTLAPDNIEVLQVAAAVAERSKDRAVRERISGRV